MFITIKIENKKQHELEDARAEVTIGLRDIGLRSISLSGVCLGSIWPRQHLA